MTENNPRYVLTTDNEIRDTSLNGFITFIPKRACWELNNLNEECRSLILQRDALRKKLDTFKDTAKTREEEYRRKIETLEKRLDIQEDLKNGDLKQTQEMIHENVLLRGELDEQKRVNKHLLNLLDLYDDQYDLKRGND